MAGVECALGNRRMSANLRYIAWSSIGLLIAFSYSPAGGGSTNSIYDLAADGEFCGVTYSSDVVRGDWQFDRLHKNGYQDYGCQIVSSDNGHPVRSGSESIRFELRDGDCNSSDTFDDCANDRSRHELTQTGGQFEGEEFWYHYSIYVPPLSLKSGQAIVFMGQFQQSNGVAPLMFEDFTGGYGIRQNDANYNWLFRGVLWPNASFRNQWTDVLMHIKWSSGSDGFIKIYFNGVLTKQLIGANIQSAQSTIFHFGIYNAFISLCNCVAMPTQIVYFDEIRKGRTRDSVELTNVGDDDGNGVADAVLSIIIDMLL